MIHQEQFDTLKEQFDTLNKHFDTLQGQSNALHEQSDTLQGQSDTLQGQSDTLQEQFTQHGLTYAYIQPNNILLLARYIDAELLKLRSAYFVMKPRNIDVESTQSHTKRKYAHLYLRRYAFPRLVPAVSFKPSGEIVMHRLPDDCAKAVCAGFGAWCAHMAECGKKTVPVYDY